MTAEPQPTAPKGRSGYSIIRLGLTFAFAAIADTVGVPFGEFGVVVFDLIVAVVLAIILGRLDWILLPALLLEAIPVVGLFPSWVTAVSVIVGKQALQKSLPPGDK